MMILHQLWPALNFFRRGICEDSRYNTEKSFGQQRKISGGEVPCEAMGSRKETGRRQADRGLQLWASLRTTVSSI